MVLTGTVINVIVKGVVSFNAESFASSTLTRVLSKKLIEVEDDVAVGALVNEIVPILPTPIFPSSPGLIAITYEILPVSAFISLNKTVADGPKNPVASDAGSTFTLEIALGSY